MKPVFSEFQFSYFVTREIDNCLVWPRGPYIPNQADEANLGFDVFFLNNFVALFLQYKLSDMLNSKRAREWDYFEQEYFRFSIYPDNRSHQHNLLQRQSHRCPKCRVYYCAPLFIEFSDLINYYRQYDVLEHSVFVDCSYLPLIAGDDKHCICYTDNPLYGYMFSNSMDVKIEKDIEKLYSKEDRYINFSDFINDMNIFFREEKVFEENTKGTLQENRSEKHYIQDITHYLNYNDLDLILLRV